MRKPNGPIRPESGIGSPPMRCRLVSGDPSSLVEIFPCGNTSGVVRIIQRANGRITGELTVPREQFFDFMEAIIHYAATIEPKWDSKVARGNKSPQPATGRKRQDRFRSRRSRK